MCYFTKGGFFSSIVFVVFDGNELGIVFVVFVYKLHTYWGPKLQPSSIFSH